MNFLNEILNDLNETNYKKVINKINDINDINNILNETINNLNEIDNNTLEPLIKIILGKIIKFNGEVDTKKTELLYDKLFETNNSLIELLDNFIKIYDEYMNIKILYLSLTYKLLKSFKNQFQVFNKFLKKTNLNKNDIEEITKIINNEIHLFFQAIFDLNFNNNHFFKRITDCNDETSQRIHTEEMVKRMLQVTKILGIKILFKLKLNIITVKEFYNIKYSERVNYFRLFYIKTYSLFKLYNKYYKLMNNFQNNLLNLIKIDPLDYVDRFEDSSSSFLLSEEYLNMNIDIDNKDKLLEFNSSSENRDTPYLIQNELLNENEDENKNNDKDSNSINYEDKESDIFDLFVKN